MKRVNYYSAYYGKHYDFPLNAELLFLLQRAVIKYGMKIMNVIIYDDNNGSHE